MKKFDLQKVKEADLCDFEEVARAFKEYLMEAAGVDESGADFVVHGEFFEPYTCEYVYQDCEGGYRYGDHVYEVRLCYTDITHYSPWWRELPRFEFYMCFDCDTLPDHTGGSYLNARRKYILQKPPRWRKAVKKRK